jgi:hypothetical protein
MYHYARNPTGAAALLVALLVFLAGAVAEPFVHLDELSPAVAAGGSGSVEELPTDGPEPAAEHDCTACKLSRAVLPAPVWARALAGPAAGSTAQWEPGHRWSRAPPSHAPTHPRPPPIL